MSEVVVNTQAEQAILEAQRAGARRAMRLPLRVSERRALLMGLDLLAVNLALLLALAVRPRYELDWQLLVQHPVWFLLLSALWLCLGQAFDAYDLRVAARLTTAALATLKTSVATVVIYILIPFLTPTLPNSRTALFAFLLLSAALPVAVRGLYILAVAQPLFLRRVLIVGAGWAGRTIAEALLEQGEGMYRIVGFVDDDPAKRGASVHVPVATGESSDGRAFEVLGDRGALRDLIDQRQVTSIVVAISNGVTGELLETLMDCLEMGVEIIPMSELYEQLTGRVPVEHVGGSWYVSMPIHHAGTGTLWPLIKRAMDVAIGLTGVLVLAVMTPFVALAIRLDSPGPIFYSQERIGLGGRRFRIQKFRSMVRDAENGRALWAQKNDGRVTRVGRILRRTHVDELPQFLNILRGDMSVVGPRPERPEFVGQLAKEIPFYRVRHAVKPGAAGWGLVRYGYGASKEDALVKLQYDLYYIKHQSLWLDLVILIKTIITIVTLRGR